MSDTRWEIHQNDNYKIYRSSWDWFFKYTVCGPRGEIVDCTCTLWGARRAIKRHIKKYGGRRPKHWEGELVAQYPKEGR